ADLGGVSPETMGKVTEEFYRTAAGGGHTGPVEDYLQKVLSKALGPGKTAWIMDHLRKPTEEASFSALKFLDNKTIANFLKAEHPQTIAVVLAHLDPLQAGAVLTLLPEEIQADVAMRMACLENVPPGVIKEIDEIIQHELQAAAPSKGADIRGLDAVAEMLNQLNKSTELHILSRIEEANPEMASNIRQLMFTFDDLVLVDDRGMQQILKEVPNNELVLALKTASEPVKDKILKNMSERAAQMITEDLEALGPVRLSDVEKAQKAILKVAKKLEDEGKIILAGRGGGDIVV
ncbi:MAG: flagellar motor switch protein FliG, partial [Deltaproteobacteria bacterium]|nr:flagellar motor switch protein FliG [Deltaproteobacteria bacterium]